MAKWIQDAVKRQEEKGTVGLFGRKAKRHGMSTKEYAAHVMANKEHEYPATVKQANFARNVSK